MRRSDGAPRSAVRSRDARAPAGFALIVLILVTATALSFKASATEERSSEKPSSYPLATQGPKPAAVTPPTNDELDGAIGRGVEFLLKAQRKNGAWGGPQKTKELNIYAPVPGAHLAFRTGVTSLAIEALLNARPMLRRQKQDEIDRSVDRGEQWLIDQGDQLRRAEQDALYNVWGHAYAIHAIAKLHDRPDVDKEQQEQLLEQLQYHIDRLKRYTFVNGGWGYYDFEAHTRTPSGSPNSFVTATVLIALKKAKALGGDYPAEMTKKAVESILRQRYPDFSYAYGEYLRMMPRMDINRPGGSLGRSQACNIALRMYGDDDVTDEVLETWLNRLYARNGWLSIGRKRPIPHESHFSVAGYFYYYGHYYAAMCIEALPEADQAYHQNQLARILLPLQEKDGSWWDYPLYDYHQSWGTAMAVSSLIACRHD